MKTPFDNITKTNTGSFEIRLLNKVGKNDSTILIEIDSEEYNFFLLHYDAQLRSEEKREGIFFFTDQRQLWRELQPCNSRAGYPEGYFSPRSMILGGTLRNLGIALLDKREEPRSDNGLHHLQRRLGQPMSDEMQFWKQKLNTLLTRRNGNLIKLLERKEDLNNLKFDNLEVSILHDDLMIHDSFKDQYKEYRTMQGPYRLVSPEIDLIRLNHETKKDIVEIFAALKDRQPWKQHVGSTTSSLDNELLAASELYFKGKVHQSFSQVIESIVQSGNETYVQARCFVFYSLVRCRILRADNFDDCSIPDPILEYFKQEMFTGGKSSRVLLPGYYNFIPEEGESEANYEEHYNKRSYRNTKRARF